MQPDKSFEIENVDTVQPIKKLSSFKKRPPMRAFTMGQKKSNEFENIQNTLWHEEDFSEYSKQDIDTKSRVKFEESQLETASKFEVSIQTKQQQPDNLTLKSAGKKSNQQLKKKTDRSVKVRK